MTPLTLVQVARRLSRLRVGVCRDTDGGYLVWLNVEPVRYRVSTLEKAIVLGEAIAMEGNEDQVTVSTRGVTRE